MDQLTKEEKSAISRFRNIYFNPNNPNSNLIKCELTPGKTILTSQTQVKVIDHEDPSRSHSTINVETLREQLRAILKDTLRDTLQDTQLQKTLQQGLQDALRALQTLTTTREDFEEEVEEEEEEEILGELEEQYRQLNLPIQNPTQKKAATAIMQYTKKAVKIMYDRSKEYEKTQLPHQANHIDIASAQSLAELKACVQELYDVETSLRPKRSENLNAINVVRFMAGHCVTQIKRQQLDNNNTDDNNAGQVRKRRRLDERGWDDKIKHYQRQTRMYYEFIRTIIEGTTTDLEDYADWESNAKNNIFDFNAASYFKDINITDNWQILKDWIQNYCVAQIPRDPDVTMDIIDYNMQE